VGLLAEGAEPTQAYWLPDLPTRIAETSWVRLDPRKPPDQQRLAGLAAVLVVRTLPSAWLTALQALRRAGVPVVLLLDDALLDPGALAEQAWGYRWRLWWGLTRHRNQLHTLISQLWLTSPALEETCRRAIGTQGIPIQRLPLHPPLRVVQPRPMHRVAYLGTASHGAELRWLWDVLGALQRRRADCLLELVLPPHWRRRYRQLPRTRIFYPLDWETFLLDTGNRQVDLLLVPLLPNRFNQGRAPVKFFDAARLGAVGLYSQRPPYAGFVRDQEDGLLLPDAPAAWLEAMDQLLNHPEAMQAMANSCRQRALRLCTVQADPCGD
jgi:hypothetical protein